VRERLALAALFLLFAAVTGGTGWVLAPFLS